MITELRLEEAMKLLANTDEKSAQLQAFMEESKYKAKVVEATVKLHQQGTVSEREALALIAPETQEAWAKYFKAVADFRALENQREFEARVVDLWRSINANRRVGNI